MHLFFTPLLLEKYSKNKASSNILRGAENLLRPYDDTHNIKGKHHIQEERKKK
jgi:hypothetical protein